MTTGGHGLFIFSGAEALQHMEGYAFLSIYPGGPVQHRAEAAGPCCRVYYCRDLYFCKTKKHHQYGKHCHPCRCRKSPQYRFSDVHNKTHLSLIFCSESIISDQVCHKTDFTSAAVFLFTDHPVLRPDHQYLLCRPG